MVSWEKFNGAFKFYVSKFCLILDLPNVILELKVRRESHKKKYETLDICPKWVYPTYLVL